MDLKKYIAHAYEMESILYSEKCYRDYLVKLINTHSNPNYFATEYVEPNYISDIGDLARAIGSILCFGLMGGGLALPVSILVYLFSDMKISSFFTWCIAFGLVIGLLIEICGMVKRDSSRENALKNNEGIKRANMEIYSNAEKKVNILKQERARIEEEIRKTSSLLSDFYNADVVYLKYRNLVAVSSFYEYLQSGRCSVLEGHEGAYNIFENEIRQNIIISKLDEVIKRLDVIQQNQYMLYTAIKDTRQTINRLSGQMSLVVDGVNRIESNTEISAYHSQIAAKNTEFIKWVQIIK